MSTRIGGKDEGLKRRSRVRQVIRGVEVIDIVKEGREIDEHLPAPTSLGGIEGLRPKRPKPPTKKAVTLIHVEEKKTFAAFGDTVTQIPFLDKATVSLSGIEDLVKKKSKRQGKKLIGEVTEINTHQVQLGDVAKLPAYDHRLKRKKDS